jgi:hypothetical protein
MKFEPKEPPRRFTVGNSVRFDMRDCGVVRLDSNDQVTFVAASGAEYDVAAKDWGFYATPSLNGRLEAFGLRGILIRNQKTRRYFVLLVEKGCEPQFESYCEQESLIVIAWLDSSAALDGLAKKLGVSP